MKTINSGEPLQSIGAAGLGDVEKAVFAYVQLRRQIDASLPEIMAERGFSEDDIARAMAHDDRAHRTRIHGRRRRDHRKS